jgi:hypothetical protein
VHLQQHPWVGPLGDRVHVVLFAALALVLHRRGPLRGHAWRALVASAVAGGLIEFLQILAGRSASIWDWYQDLQGVGLAGCWLWWRHSGRPAGPLLAASVVLFSVLWPLRHVPVVAREAIIVQQQFPRLADFERPRSQVLWSGYRGGEAERVSREDGGHALRLTSDGDDRWPGAVSRQLPWSWTGHDTLLVDVRLVAPAPDTVRVSVWLEDRRTGHDRDYALRTWPVGHQWTTLRMPLDDLQTRRRGRPLALHTIAGVAVFMHRRGQEPLAMEIDDVRLAPAVDSAP